MQATRTLEWVTFVLVAGSDAGSPAIKPFNRLYSDRWLPEVVSAWHTKAASLTTLVWRLPMLPGQIDGRVTTKETHGTQPANGVSRGPLICQSRQGFLPAAVAVRIA